MAETREVSVGADDFDSLGTLSLELLCHRPTELMWRKESPAWILEVKGREWGRPEALIVGQEVTETKQLCLKS